jgi:hypothetical protein
LCELDEASVRCAAAGVLVNVCGAGPQCSAAAALAARALLAAASAGDAPTAALLARALWNAHAHAPLTPQCAHHTAAALATFIGNWLLSHNMQISNIYGSNSEQIPYEKCHYFEII